MPDRADESTLRRRITGLQLAIAVIANAKFVADRLPGREPAYSLDLNDGRPVAIRGAGRRLQLRVTEQLRFSAAPDPSRLHTQLYRYELRTFDGPEILAYHLHPSASPAIPSFPHLHISGGAGDVIPELQRAHLPTGPVTLADFVSLLIRDFGVRPIRADWASVLDPGGPR